MKNFILAMVCLVCVPVMYGQLVINEVDYDQPGGDVDEFVEILNTGASSEDLSLYDFVAVNGSNGTEYIREQLTGSLSSGAYFIICANSSSQGYCDHTLADSDPLQNGAPDAVAICLTGTTTIVDTVSYEGVVTGWTEGDAGTVADSGAGSLVRCPNGADSDQNSTDFIFSSTISPDADNDCPDATNTPGGPTETPTDTPVPTDTPTPGPTNTPGGVAYGDIVINEIMYDSAGADEEWVELYNTTGSAIDVSGWCLSDSGSWPYFGEGYLEIPGSTTIAAGGYLVISEVDLTDITCELVCGQTGDWALGNNGDNLALFTDSSAGAMLVDGSLTVHYPDLSISNSGASIEKWPEGTDWGTGDWYAATTITGSLIHVFHTACSANAEPTTPIPSMTPIPTDTPGGPTETPTDTPAPTDTPTQEPTSTPSGYTYGDITINEIMYDSAGSPTDEEWVELYNASGSPIDVSGWCLTDDDAWPYDTEGYLLIPALTIIPTGGYLVVSDVDLTDITCEVICTEEGNWGLGNNGDNLALFTAPDAGGDLIAGSLTNSYPDLAGGNAGASIEKWTEGTTWETGAWNAATTVSGSAEHVYHTACAMNAEPAATPSPGPTDTPDPPTSTPTVTPTSSQVYGDVVINEIMYDSAGVEEEWVELFNATDQSIDISGWILTDSDSYPSLAGEGYLTIPNSTILAAGGYIVVTKYDIAEIDCETLCVETGAFQLNNPVGDNLVLYTDLSGSTMVDGSLSVMYPDLQENLGISLEKDDSGTTWPMTPPTGWHLSTQNHPSNSVHINHTACGPNSPPGTPEPTSTPGGPTSTPTPPTGVTINEVFIDPIGGDAGCFIELFYPGGISLDTLSIVGVNGSSGDDYNTISLAGESIPADGFFVIAQDGTVANADLIDPLVNFQNGPDSIQIRQGVIIVDAIGYGDFSGGEIFAGEGEAVAKPSDQTYTFSRIPDGDDSEDNATDFLDGFLTPGEGNVEVVATPTPTPPPTGTPSPIPTASAAGLGLLLLALSALLSLVGLRNANHQR